MGNLKEIDEPSLLQAIERARADAKATIDRAADEAAQRVRDAMALARSDLPALMDVVQGTDLAFVIQAEIGYPNSGPQRESFVLQIGGRYLHLGDAAPSPGTYRLLLFGVRRP